MKLFQGMIKFFSQEKLLNMSLFRKTGTYWTAPHLVPTKGNAN